MVVPSWTVTSYSRHAKSVFRKNGDLEGFLNERTLRAVQHWRCRSVQSYVRQASDFTLDFREVDPP
jgi:hypothetical protein